MSSLKTFISERTYFSRIQSQSLLKFNFKYKEKQNNAETPLREDGVHVPFPRGASGVMYARFTPVVVLTFTRNIIVQKVQKANDNKLSGVTMNSITDLIPKQIVYTANLSNYAGLAKWSQAFL